MQKPRNFKTVLPGISNTRTLKRILRLYAPFILHILLASSKSETKVFTSAREEIKLRNVYFLRLLNFLHLELFTYFFEGMDGRGRTSDLQQIISSHLK